MTSIELFRSVTRGKPGFGRVRLQEPWLGEKHGVETAQSPSKPPAVHMWDEVHI